MRPPDFWVIGAMKSGTTTLFHDLSLHPRIRLADKESPGLGRHDPTDPAGLDAYLRQWRDAGPTDVLGEVACHYAMAPLHPSPAGRAARVSPRARVVYIVREPVSRIISHHHHDVASGVADPDIDRAVRSDPRFLDYSRYATQLDAWRRHFHDSSIRVIRFEDYVRHRRAETSSLLDWLGLPPLAETVDLDRRDNASASRQAARGLVRRALHSRTYRERVRPRVPQQLRSRVAASVLPAPTTRPAPPGPDTVGWLTEQLRPEVGRLRQLTEGRVGWDLDEVTAAFRRPSS